MDSRSGLSHASAYPVGLSCLEMLMKKPLQQRPAVAWQNLRGYTQYAPPDLVVLTAPWCFSLVMS